VPFCAVPRADGQIEAWCRRGVHAFLIGDARGVTIRAFKAHLRDRQGKAGTSSSRRRS
jgi:4-hydroxy-2-oxoheptanedioate aldolase